MKCKKCRKVIPDDSKFCCYCGAPQAAKPKMYRRSDGLFEKIVTVDGKRIYFHGKTEKEVERKILEYNERRETGEPFSAVAEEWKEEHFPKLSPNSLSNYTPAFNRAVDYFADTPIAQIKPPDIQKFLAAQPRISSPKNSDSTRRRSRSSRQSRLSNRTNITECALP